MSGLELERIELTRGKNGWRVEIEYPTSVYAYESWSDEPPMTLDRALALVTREVLAVQGSAPCGRHPKGRDASWRLGEERSDE
jgi:hypothetical protein